MYPGWLSYNGFAGDSTEIINTHRVVTYAQKAGLWWVQGCDQCESIGRTSSITEPPPLPFSSGPVMHQTPLLDYKAGSPPPWWDAENQRDSENFLGVMGLTMTGADDSTRQVDLVEGSVKGGYLGSMGFSARSIVIRALLIATDDCALGFGLDWLRSLDTSPACFSSTFGLYECCPCMCAPECDDPECQSACVLPRRREVTAARLAKGPTVLRRRLMSVGAMAEVEMIVIAGDPAVYELEQVAASFITDAAVPFTDTVVPVVDTVDPFAAYSPYRWMGPARSLTVEPRISPRSEWLRQVEPVPIPDSLGRHAIIPTVRLWAAGGTAEDVRVTLRRNGEQVADFRVPIVPDGGQVSVDLGRRKVMVEANGVERQNQSFVMASDGRLLRWPAELTRGDYEVVVDRAPWSPPIGVEVGIAGQVSG